MDAFETIPVLRRRGKPGELTLTVSAEGEAIVTADPACSDEEIRAFLGRHRRFLASRVARAAKTRRLFSDVLAFRAVLLCGRQVPLVFETDEGFCDGTLRARSPARVPKLVESLCAAAFLKRTAEIAAAMEIAYASVSFQSAKTLWGTCDRARNLRFNRAALMLPPRLCDCLIVHELAHCLHPDHSPAFRRAMSAVLPDASEREREMKGYAFLLTLYRKQPLDQGYELMPDFEHSATLILFPYRKDVWNNVEAAQAMHLEWIRKISQYERVYVGVRREELEKVSELRGKNIVVFVLEQDDAWIRDSGPLFVKKGSDVKMVRNRFNAWGGLYRDWSHDLKITERLSEFFRCDYYENDFVLEGGNLTADGKGTAILVENCFLNANRNTFSREEAEMRLKAGLGLKRILWLRNGFVDDETGGHIDNVCRFLPDGSLVIAWTDQKEHPMYARCREIKAELLKQDAGLCIRKLPLPPAQYRQIEEIIDCESAKKRLSRELLTASYVNYYETDRAVFVPQFAVEEDSEALQAFRTLFPGREIVPIDSRAYILAGGGLHCLTLGVPF